MIAVRVTFLDGTVSDLDFEDIDKVTDFIREHSETLTILEIDIESSNHNRPAFWRSQ